MKVAIVGSAASSANDAPWKDKSWQIWGLAWRMQAMPRYDLMFEMHRRERWSSRMPKEYKEALSNMQCPVVMPEKYDDIKASVAFPWDWARNHFKSLGVAEYYGSSVSYMFDYALYKGVKELGIFGVDMLTDSEYAIQRPNAEWYLGVLMGKGVKVTVAPGSALLKANHRYGIEEMPGEGAINKIHLDARIKYLEAKKEEHKQSGLLIEGALREVQVLHDLGKIEEDFVKERVAFYTAQRDQHTQALWVHEGGRQEAVATLDYLKNWQRGGIIPGDSQKAKEAGNADANGSGPAEGSVQGATPAPAEPRSRKTAPKGDSPIAETRRLPAKKK